MNPDLLNYLLLVVASCFRMMLSSTVRYNEVLLRGMFKPGLSFRSVDRARKLSQSLWTM